MDLLKLEEIIDEFQKLPPPGHGKQPATLAEYLAMKIMSEEKGRVVMQNAEGLGLVRIVIWNKHANRKMYSGMLTQIKFAVRRKKPIIKFTIYSPEAIKVTAALASLTDIVFWSRPKNPHVFNGSSYFIKEGKLIQQPITEEGSNQCSRHQ